MSDLFYDSAYQRRNYVPRGQMTPEEREQARASGRERSKRYYDRKRAKEIAIRSLQASTDQAYGICAGCKIEMIMLCGFCKEGLSG